MSNCTKEIKENVITYFLKENIRGQLFMCMEFLINFIRKTPVFIHEILCTFKLHKHSYIALK